MLGVDDESAMLDNDTGATACQLTAAQLSQLLGSMYAEEPMAPPADLAEMLVFDDCNGSSWMGLSWRHPWRMLRAAALLAKALRHGTFPSEMSRSSRLGRFR